MMGNAVRYNLMLSAALLSARRAANQCSPSPSAALILQYQDNLYILLTANNEKISLKDRMQTLKGDTALV